MMDTQLLRELELAVSCGERVLHISTASSLKCDPAAVELLQATIQKTTERLNQEHRMSNIQMTVLRNFILGTCQAVLADLVSPGDRKQGAILVNLDLDIHS